MLSLLSQVQRLVCGERRRATLPSPPMLQLQSKAEAARRMRLERRKKLAEDAAGVASRGDGCSAHFNAPASGANGVDFVNGHRATNCSATSHQRSEAQSRSVNGARAPPQDADVLRITTQVAKNRICDASGASDSGQVFECSSSLNVFVSRCGVQPLRYFNVSLESVTLERDALSLTA